MVTTHKKSKTKTHNFKKGGKQKKSMEYHQTETVDRNKGKEPMEAQSYQKTRDKIAVGNTYT